MINLPVATLCIGAVILIVGLLTAVIGSTEKDASRTKFGLTFVLVGAIIAIISIAIIVS